MLKLKQTPKITLATLKSFARRNADKIYYKELSRFDGMSDMVENNDNPEWKKSEIIPMNTKNSNYYYRSGILGIYTVGCRDYFELYEDDTYFGIEVWNSCGSSILAVKKV